MILYPQQYYICVDFDGRIECYNMVAMMGYYNVTSIYNTYDNVHRIYYKYNDY